MGIEQLFNSIYRNKSVFLTGHTGFKGSWMALWLQALGANVTGYSMPPEMSPNHWDLLKLDINSRIGDIRDYKYLADSLKQNCPEIVFHFAAQPIVRESYVDPLKSWSTNVLGTAQILEACRQTKSVKAIVIVTTDKVYDNKEWMWGYREVDDIGGHDPYSASKASAEIVVNSYRKSFFHGENGPFVATVRSGNVIGGGDWSKDRLIPDFARANEVTGPVVIRSPLATRPWQHVLDCLSGYLLLGQRLLEQGADFSEAWNFGPSIEDNRQVVGVLEELRKYWPEMNWIVPHEGIEQPHESSLLNLDSTKARRQLLWSPVWSLDSTLFNTAAWYKSFISSGEILTQNQLAKFIEQAQKKELVWTQ